MIGIPKEVVLKDLHEVLAKAMEETGDFDAEKYCFVFSQSLYRTLELWISSKHIQDCYEKDIIFGGVKIEIQKNTQYFYLEYSNSNFLPTAAEIEKISNIVGNIADEKNIKKIPLMVKTFAPTETIKKYIQEAWIEYKN